MSREAVYCREAATVVAWCDDADDLLITGGCLMTAPREGVYLAASYPAAEMAASFVSPAGWWCVWGFAPGVPNQPVADFGGKARVCCVSVP